MGFRVGTVRESEYEVSFGLAPRNGELSPSDPKTPEPFNSPFRSGPGTGTDFRFDLPAKFGVGWSKLGSRGINLFDFQGGEDFFDLSVKKWKVL